MNARIMIAELSRLARRDGFDGSERAREIGRALNALGGFELMVVAHDLLLRDLLGTSADAIEIARSLRTLWDGIGEFDA